MPMRLPHVCSCGKRVPGGQTCECVKKRRDAKEAQRPSARERGYDSWWERESKAFLALPGNELCACGCGRRAEMVDHIKAPKGDMRLFRDKQNWQPYTRRCNTRKAIRTEGGLGRPVKRDS